ncbi:hypothetical protein DERF_013495 [Dermatophagoides farinae]|uniref:Uncharacterized protein n=1 Tax=Dermatophagoides farinae TaxID=6954 RepID=A0A922L0L5_DERFA|nr:hypothetical protein DERF_013495 [Dermatophagoides farinae]
MSLGSLTTSGSSTMMILNSRYDQNFSKLCEKKEHNKSSIIITTKTIKLNNNNRKLAKKKYTKINQKTPDGCLLLIISMKCQFNELMIGTNL